MWRHRRVEPQELELSELRSEVRETPQVISGLGQGGSDGDSYEYVDSEESEIDTREDAADTYPYPNHYETPVSFNPDYQDGAAASVGAGAGAYHSYDYPEAPDFSRQEDYSALGPHKHYEQAPQRSEHASAHIEGGARPYEEPVPMDYSVFRRIGTDAASVGVGEYSSLQEGHRIYGVHRIEKDIVVLEERASHTGLKVMHYEIPMDNHNYESGPAESVGARAGDVEAEVRKYEAPVANPDLGYVEPEKVIGHTSRLSDQEQGDTGPYGYVDIIPSDDKRQEQERTFPKSIIKAYEKAQKKVAKTHKQWLKKGIAAYNYFKYEEALECFNKSIELKPKSADSHHLKSSSLFALGKKEEAISLLKSILESYSGIEFDIRKDIIWYSIGIKYYLSGKYEEACNSQREAANLLGKVRLSDIDVVDSREKAPLYSKIYSEHAKALMENEEYEEALEKIDKAIQYGKKEHKNYYIKSLLLERLGRYEECLVECSKKIKLNPKEASYYSNKAYILEKIGKNQEALDFNSKALRIDPKNIILLYQKVILLNKLMKYQDAIELCDKAIALHPKLMGFYYEKGRSLYELEKYEEAIIEYNKTLEIVPNYYICYKNIANAQEKLGKAREAKEAIDKYKELKPKTVNIHFQNAESLQKGGTFKLKDVTKIIDLYNKATELDPENHYYFYKKAVFQSSFLLEHSYCYMKQDGLDSINKAIALSPDNPKYYNLKGIILSDLHFDILALESFNKAILLDPTYFLLYENKVETLFNLGRYEEALESIDKAISLDSKSHIFNQIKAKILSKLSRYEEALEFADKAIEIKPKSADIISLKAKILFDTGKKEEAIGLLEYALDFLSKVEFDIPKYIINYNLGYLYLEFGEYTKASLEFKKIKGLISQELFFKEVLTHTMVSSDKLLDSIICKKIPYFYSKYAVALMTNEEYEEALEKINKAIEFNPKQASYYSDKAYMLEKIGKNQEAIDVQNKGLEIDPKNINLLYQKVLLLNKLMKYQDAIELCDKAIALHPKLVEFYYEKGRSLYKLEKYEEAIIEYNKTLEIFPKHYKCYKNIANALEKLGKEREAKRAIDKYKELKLYTANLYFQNAEALQKECNTTYTYKMIIELYDKATELEPENHYYFYKKALLQMNLYPKIYDGLDAINEAIALSPDNPEYYNLRGIILSKQHFNIKALESFNKAIALDPVSYILHKNKAEALEILGRYEEAIESIDQAIDLDHHDESSYRLKGKIHEKLNNYEAALKAYDMAIKLVPRNHIAHESKGYVLKILERYEDALEEFAKSYSIMPTSEFSSKYYDIFDKLSDEKKLTKLYVEFENLSDSKAQKITHIKIADILVKIDRKEEALEQYEKALSIDSEEFEALMGKAKILYSLDKYKQAYIAITLAEESYTKSGHNISFDTFTICKEEYEFVEDILIKSGKKDDVFKRYDIVLRNSHESNFYNDIARIYFCKAKASVKFGLESDAIEAFEYAIKEAKGSVKALYIKEKSYYLKGLGEIKSALREIGKFIKNEPSKELYNLKIDFLKELGKYESALKVFDNKIQDSSSPYERVESTIEKCMLLSELDKIQSIKKAMESIRNSANYLYVYSPYNVGMLDIVKNLIEYDTNYANYHLYLGNILVSMKKYDEALKEFDIALELNINCPDIWFYKGILLLKMERLEESRDCFKVSKLSSETALELINRGDELTTDLEKNFLYSTFLEFDPKYMKLIQNKATILYYIGKYEEALEYANKGLHDSIYGSDFYKLKAFILSALGKDLEAITAYNNYARLIYNSEIPADHSYPINIIINVFGTSKQAVKFAREIDLNHESAESYSNVAQILYKAGRYRKSVDALDKAIELELENPKYYIDKALVLDKMGLDTQAEASKVQAHEIQARYCETVVEETEAGATACTVKLTGDVESFGFSHIDEASV